MIIYIADSTLNQMNLTDIYRIFYPKATEYILFKHAWNILQDTSNVRPQNKS